MARRGARRLEDGGADADRERPTPAARRSPAGGDIWIDEGPVERQSTRSRPGRGSGGARERSRLPPEVVEELARHGGSRGERDAKRLAEASRAYRRERYADARRLLEPLARNAPGVAGVRELYGLSLYRLGRWKAALRELEAAAHQAGSFDQHPVRADCHRALGQRAGVQRLWDELRLSGAPPPVMVEGRIVAASSLADVGDVDGAIRLLEQGPVEVRSPRPHHLRLWYVLATLYEQVGDVARARHLLAQVLDHDPDLPGARERYQSLD